MDTTEITCIEKIKSGDVSSFERLFKDYYSMLCNFAYGIVKDSDSAEELVQKLFCNLWEKREELNINTSIKSYLYTAVRNACLNTKKHLKVRMEYEKEYLYVNRSAQDESGMKLETKELRDQIETAISKLPEQCRQVFKLSRFEELKYREIAEVLNISIKTVENHMGKALKILREELKYLIVLLLLLLIK